MTSAIDSRLGVIRFGDTEIVLYDGDDKLPVGPFLGRHQGLLAGGAVGGWGDQRRRSGLRVVSKSGTMIADSTTEMDTLKDAMRALGGTRDELYIRMADGSVRWLYADCEDVDITEGAANVLEVPVVFTWIPLDPYWRTEHQGAGWDLDSGIDLDAGRDFDEGDDAVFDIDPSPTLNYCTVTNSGNVPATLVKITIHAGSADITTDVGAGYAVRLISTTTTGGVIPDGNFDVRWAGTLDAGDDLVLDGAALSVTNNTIDAYAGLSFGDTGHMIDGWFLLQAGDTRIQAIIFGGGTGATMTVDFDSAFA